jgi:hypothetical protein
MRITRALSSSLCFGVAAACGGGGDAGPDAGIDAPLEGYQGADGVCPGATGCAAGDGGRLFAGAAARIFTPALPETFTDEDGDGNWDNEEPYVDANGNGEFDATWLFGGGRAANSVKNDLQARALVLREGDTSVAIVYLDAIGMLGQGGDLQAIEEAPEVRAAGVDLVIAGATHAHDAVDTIGLWGPSPFESSYRQAYNDAVRAAAVAAIVEAAGEAEEVEATMAQVLLLDDPANPAAGTGAWLTDIRDPVIYDPTMTVARFTAVDDGATVGTLVHLANHPEVSSFGADNLQISANFAHYLREGVEQGVPSVPPGGAGLPGVGGVTVFAQGPLGGQIGSLRAAVPGPDGTPITEQGHPKEEALGTNFARRALQALAEDGEAVTELPVSYRTTILNARVDNTGFQLAFGIDLLAPHTLVGYDAEQAPGRGNEPWVPFRASYLQVGPLGLVTVPGELHPELWVGGYDCSTWTWGYECFDATLPNLPDFAAAPEPPYLRDLVLANEGVRFPVCLGLAHDYVGYIVPAYNYVLSENSPYIDEAEGDHYEETYSLGPDVQRHTVDAIMQLVADRP